MASLRTKETKERYQAYQASGGLVGACVLCEKSALQTFKYWKIVENDFPYDKVAKVHNMLVPLRHATEGELTEEEKQEFGVIKASADIQDVYSFLIEATKDVKSIPSHYHLHLVVIKDDIQ